MPSWHASFHCLTLNLYLTRGDASHGLMRNLPPPREVNPRPPRTSGKRSETALLRLRVRGRSGRVRNGVKWRRVSGSQAVK